MASAAAPQLAILIALSATIGGALIWRLWPRNVPLTWAVSVTLAWTLFSTLLLSYQHYGNSYRGLVSELKVRMGRYPSFVARRDLGEPQRAILDYLGGIRTRSESALAWIAARRSK